MKTIEELHAEVQEELERCTTVKDGLDRRRKRRNRVFRKTIALQGFCAKMSKLIETFPGINDAGKAGHQQIGGGLVACLSTLFQIGRNKNGREEAITDAIDRLTLGLQQMKVLANALGDHRVDDVVRDVYKKVEGFCKTSIEYYKMSPYGRLWEAIANPYKLGIAIEIDGIKDSIMSALQMSYVVHLAELKEKDGHSYKNRSAKLTGMLLANNHQISRNVNMMKAECEKLHESAFKAHPGGYGEIQLQEIDVGRLERHAGLQDWSETRYPAVFFLLGDNMDENDDNRGLLWLSPAALQILRIFNAPVITLFYSASPQQPKGYRSHKIPLDHVLSSIIDQLLNSSSVFFDKHYEYVHWQLEQEENDYKTRLALLLRLLQSFQEHETVVVVLDRLDLIEQDGLEPWDIIDDLVTVVADINIVCAIKLAIVGLQNDFRSVKHIDDIAKKRKWVKRKGRKISIYGRLNWTQEVLDDD